MIDDDDIDEVTALLDAKDRRIADLVRAVTKLADAIDLVIDAYENGDLELLRQALAKIKTAKILGGWQ